MRYGLIALLACLGILFYLGMDAAPSGGAVSLGALRPTRFLRTVGHGAQLLVAKAGALGQELFDTVGTDKRMRDLVPDKRAEPCYWSREGLLTSLTQESCGNLVADSLERFLKTL